MNRHAALLLALTALLSAGCTSARVPSAAVAPSEVLGFKVLFTQNCAGCHGPDGRGGAAISLSDPVYLEIADDTAIRRTVENGVPGTPMPAFAQKSGGMLTDKQIEVLVQGIRAWAPSGADQIAGVPLYQPQQPGDPQRGAEVYRTYCSACHGADGRGGKGGSIVDSSYLALVSDHDLRMSVILGHPSAGAPDWRSDVPGQPLSEQQVSDVVAWMASHRTAFPGQPYPSSKTELGGGTQ